MSLAVNQTPVYDDSENTTGCCPKFDPDGWDDQVLTFQNKVFLKTHTRSIMHVPLNMGRVFDRAFAKVLSDPDYDAAQSLVLSHELSSWGADHYFATANPLPGENIARLSGEFATKVFDGPYTKAARWFEEMHEVAKAKGREPGRVYFYYTTCPKCAKTYGKNYVVGFVELR